MQKDDRGGALPSGRATHEQSPQAVSALTGECPSRMPTIKLRGPWPRDPNPFGFDRDGHPLRYDIEWVKDWRDLHGSTLRQAMNAHEAITGIRVSDEHAQREDGVPAESRRDASAVREAEAPND